MTIVSSTPHICPKEDADVAAVLVKRLKEEGVTIHDEARATKVAKRDGRKVVTVKPARGAEFDVAVDEILVATGRRPNIEGLNLEAVGVKHRPESHRHGREVPHERARPSGRSATWPGTTSSRTGRATRRASCCATRCPRSPSRSATSTNTPWITYTEPEIAHVGLGEDEAKRRNVPYRGLPAEFLHNDRAVCDGTQEDNFAKVLIDPKGKILGAAIVHPHAGDLLGEIVLAKKNGLRLSALGSVIHAYPSLSEINGAVAREYLKTSLTPGRKKILTKLAAFLRR